MTVWKWAAVARAALTVLAWLIVAGKPDTDQLRKHMRQADQVSIRVCAWAMKKWSF